MRGNRSSILRRACLGVAVVSGLLAGSTPAAHAGLLGGVVGTTVGVVDGTVDTTVGLVNGLVGVVDAGWDEGVTTAPVPMSDVVAAVRARDLWAQGVDGRGVDIAIVDTGVAPVAGLTVTGKVVDGPDVSFESQFDEARHLDTYGHGTHLAGIAAGRDASGGPFAGVAPGSRVVSLKAGTHDGAVDVSQVIAAIDWVVQHRRANGLNIRVLNLSYGTDGVQPYDRDPLAKAVESAWHNGIVVVVAAGNEGATRTALVNPATNPYVIAVGAADLRGTVAASDDVVAPFSSRGTSARGVDLVAPGVSLLSLRVPGSSIDERYPGSVVEERYLRGSGTSQAAAVVSGAAALLLQARPTLTPDAVKALLKSSATPLPSADTRAQGAGRLDVLAASRALVPLLHKQSWTRSTGTGSLEAARGSSHVALDDVELRGEQDIMGQPWSGAAWAPKSAAGTAWTDGSWNGAEWTGSCFCTTSWSGASWTGRTWTGRTWTGSAWTGSAWTGRTWTGRTWTGGSWTGRTWTGSSWTGRTWTSGPAVA